jgi:PQQ enzyme repeat
MGDIARITPEHEKACRELFEKYGGGRNRGAFTPATISTAGGLIFIGAPKDSIFRAFNAKTGEKLWSTKLEEIAQSVPITWLGKDGMQYVAVAAGSKLFAFKLPALEKL